MGELTLSPPNAVQFELMEDVTSDANDFVNSAWFVQYVVSTVGVTAPNGLPEATRITLSESAAQYAYQTIIADIDEERRITCGVWARSPDSLGLTLYLRHIYNSAGSSFTGATTFVDISSDWGRYEFTYTFTTPTIAGSYFNFGIQSYPFGSSGDTYDLWGPYCYVDSNYVAFFPDDDYAQKDQKVSDLHISRTGRRYEYIDSTHKRVTFDTRFINSHDTALVNTWWASNAKLKFFVHSGTVVDSGYVQHRTAVMSAQLVNRELPIRKYQVPYTDLYKGTIELGTY